MNNHILATGYEALPKVELHIHLEGAIPHAALWELIQKYGGDPSVASLPALHQRFEYRDFSQFIETWSWKNQYLREYDDFRFIAEMTAQDLVAQNIQYAEILFSPSLFIRRGLEVQPIAQAIRQGFSRVADIELALIADLVRDYGPASEASTLAQLAEVKDQGIIGIGVGGSEHTYPPEPFAALYEAARRWGFRTTVHAGEAAGPRSIWGALESLQPDRIGHGTRAVEDQRLFDHLIARRIPVEMCPMSNVRTGVIKRLADHPIRQCFDHGMLISVNTDDPKMFHTSLAREYHLLELHCGFTRSEICSLILLAIQSSWLPDSRKTAFALRFRSHECWAG